MFDDKTVSNWANNLLFVQRIINTTEHESIGVSPCQLLFGNSIQLTSNPFLPVSSLNLDGRPLSQWADEMLRSQEKYLATASKAQAEKDRQHMTERLKRLDITIFPPGAWVKVMHPPTSYGWHPPNKLMMDWRGPYQVVTRLKGEYELRDPSLPDTFCVSEHLLEPYNVDTEHSTPIQVAVDDRDMYLVEEVLDIKGFWRQRRSLKLLIK